MKKSTELGKIVRAKRLAMGITLVDLAEKLGITKQAISFIETGTTKCICGSPGVVKICDFFDIDQKDFKVSQPKRKIKVIKSKTALGKRLGKYRGELCLSRKEFGKVTGLDAGIIYRLETGRKTKLNIKSLKTLEELLGCEIPEECFTISRTYSKSVKVGSPLGELITELRKERGLTQTELAKIARTCPGTIVRVENLKAIRPRRFTINKIFKALKAELPRDLIMKR